MTVYDYVDRMLIYLEIGTWNGQEIFPRLPLTEQERIELFVLRGSLRDWQKVLRSEQRGFHSTITNEDCEKFRECLYHNFGLYPKKFPNDFSPVDLTQAQVMVLQSARLIRTEFRLERS